MPLPATIEVTITPQGCGHFQVCLSGRVILESSSTPLFNSARALLAAGADPQARIQMRHVGANHVALSSTIGAAARLEVKDDVNGPRFVPFYDRQQTWPNRPPMRFGEVAAPTIAPEAFNALSSKVVEVVS